MPALLQRPLATSGATPRYPDPYVSSAPLPAFSFEHAATRWWWSLRRLSCLGPLLALCVLLVARRWIAPWWHDDAWLEHFAFLVWAPLAALVLLREPLVDAERVVSRLNLGTFAAALAANMLATAGLVRGNHRNLSKDALRDVL